ncbi:MAG: hypothetical protein JWL85_804 [Candidatus Saccharibacteria bacterium]|nr:hypothetical protein [Candidatus Saccharibacteria bacterium]
MEGNKEGASPEDRILEGILRCLDGIDTVIASADPNAQYEIIVGEEGWPLVVTKGNAPEVRQGICGYFAEDYPDWFDTAA